MKTHDERPGCFTTLLSILRLRPGTTASPQRESLPYRTTDDFLSPAESSRYRILANQVQGMSIVFPKVRLADVFFVARPNENVTYMNKISQRHLHFLICD